MTTTNHEKLGAYDTHQRATQNNRETDKRALLTIAGKLKAALDDNGQNMKAYEDAIRLNQKLWTIFQVSLCDPENKLPRELKINLLNVSRHVDKVSFGAIAHFTPQALTSLIEINRIIANGLAKNVAAPPASQGTSLPPMLPKDMPVTSLLISA